MFAGIVKEISLKTCGGAVNKETPLRKVVLKFSSKRPATPELFCVYIHDLFAFSFIAETVFRNSLLILYSDKLILAFANSICQWYNFVFVLYSIVLYILMYKPVNI